MGRLLTVSILGLVTGLGFLTVGGDRLQAVAGRTYATNFAGTENPIYEGGVWTTGRKDGLDWRDIRMTPGLAFGTQRGNTAPPYDDSTAVLSGPWNPNQEIQAIVHAVNQKGGNNPDDTYEEVELRLRTTITAHSIKGYEILFRVNHDGTQYQQIAGWNGPIGTSRCASGCAYYGIGRDLRAADGYGGIKDGDVVRARIVGSRISVYLNNVLVQQATDIKFTMGSPGIGQWYHGSTGSPADYGFTSITATDLLTTSSAAPDQRTRHPYGIGRLPQERSSWRVARFFAH